jgi:hypothetical protein
MLACRVCSATHKPLTVVLLCCAQAIAEVGGPQADDYIKCTFVQPQVSPFGFSFIGVFYDDDEALPFRSWSSGCSGGPAFSVLLSAVDGYLKCMTQKVGAHLIVEHLNSTK